jgi:hypothetical protein
MAEFPPSFFFLQPLPWLGVDLTSRRSGGQPALPKIEMEQNGGLLYI